MCAAAVVGFAMARYRVVYSTAAGAHRRPTLPLFITPASQPLHAAYLPAGRIESGWILDESAYPTRDRSDGGHSGAVSCQGACPYCHRLFHHRGRACSGSRPSTDAGCSVVAYQ